MNTKKILMILFLVVIIDQGTVLMIAPLLPQLLLELTGQVLEENSLWAGALMLSYALVQFISAPFIGKLSDTYGRKPILLVSMFLLMVDYIIIALATNIWVLFIGRVLAGIPGASVVTAFACVTDISDNEQRGKNFAAVFAAMGLGFIIGPLVSGLLVGFSLRAPFYFAAFSCFICLLLILFLLPETLRNALPKQPLRNLLKILTYPGYGYLFIGQLILVTGFQAPIVLWAFFLKHRFNWGEEVIGLSLALFGLVYVFVQAVVVRFTLPILKTKKSIILGCAFLIIGLIIIALTQTTTMFYIGVAIYSLGGISSSSAINLFTSNVSEHEQGQLQGLLSSVNSLGSIIGPPLMTGLFYFGIRQQKIFEAGLPFMVASVMFMTGLVLFLLGMRKLKVVD